jgi:hypothetical protein
VGGIGLHMRPSLCCTGHVQTVACTGSFPPLSLQLRTYPSHPKPGLLQVLFVLK